MATKIRGIEEMKHGELEFELRRGAKFIIFQYCISVIILTFRRPSDIYPWCRKTSPFRVGI